MKTKQEIVANWLPRYTGVPLEDFAHYILLVNFQNYVDRFAEWHDVPVYGLDKAMSSATAEGITIINFGMGSANAATMMDLLSAIQPKACLFLGKCGGLKHKNEIGDLILPIAAIRGEGTSNDYYPPEVPALPAFNLQKAISTTIVANMLRLLDGHRLHHQPPRLGARRRIQNLPASNSLYGNRHGDGHALHDRLLQSNPHRRAPAGLRSADDARRSQDR